VKACSPRWRKPSWTTAWKIVEVDKAPFKEAAKAAYEEDGLDELREKIYAEIGKAA
jgi:hypothetical protein